MGTINKRRGGICNAQLTKNSLANDQQTNNFLRRIKEIGSFNTLWLNLSEDSWNNIDLNNIGLTQEDNLKKIEISLG